jgi:hypothetical protein
MRSLLLGGVVVLASCGAGERDLTGDTPLAAGAHLTFQASPCDGCNRRFTAVSGVAAEDPAIAEIASVEGDQVRLRGVGTGRTRLIVNGRSSEGRQVAEYFVEVAAPQVIAAAVSCRDPLVSPVEPQLLGVGAKVPLILTVAREGRRLRGDVQWRIDPGPDLIIDHATAPQITDYTPDAPGSITVTSDLDGKVHARFVAYDASAVESLYLFTRYEQPWRAQSCLEICIQPRVGGRAACTDVGANRTAAITTPQVCRFTNLQGPLSRTVGVSECPTVCGSAAGTCRMDFQLDGMTASGSGEVRFQ